MGMAGVMLIAILPAAAGAADAQARRGVSQADAPIARPVRRPAVVAPAGLPALPATADTAPSMTLDVDLHPLDPGRGTGPVRQRIIRTRDRIHVTMGPQEWLLERNLVDPRRVAGYLVDHASRTIVFHDESDLRNRLGIGGWAHAFTLGFEVGILAQRLRTGESRDVDGVRFVRYAPAPDGPAEPDVWWSDTDSVATGFIRGAGAGAARVEVRHVETTVDLASLRLPAERFPGYASVDLAEWLEGR